MSNKKYNPRCPRQEKLKYFDCAIERISSPPSERRMCIKDVFGPSPINTTRHKHFLSDSCISKIDNSMFYYERIDDLCYNFFSKYAFDALTYKV